MDIETESLTEEQFDEICLGIEKRVNLDIER